MYKECCNLLSKLYLEIEKDFPGLIKKYPAITYVKLLDNFPKYRNAKFKSDEVNEFCNSVVNDYTVKGLGLLHKIVLLELIKRNLEDGFKYILPKAIESNFHTYFKVIIDDIENNSCYSGKYIFEQEQFIYNLGICRQSHIPAGAQIASLNKLAILSYPLYELKRLGLWWMIKNGISLIYYIIKIRPYLELHIHIFDRFVMSKFNYEGWKEGFQNLAALLEKNPQIKGLYGNSWFFDPQLKEVSPEVSFLRTLIDEIGAKCFNHGVTSCGLKNALFINKKRQDLYKRGEYMPYNYIVFISRKKLIKWSKGVS